jgi:bifunctional non-homologous end joining protein LigD
MAAERLSSYRAKRNFSATPEPAGGAQGAAGARFVVHEHHARRLHWDLRLERCGVLASWAIPNGIPAVPGERRLAVRTEDHPLEYLGFEGEIPRGSYGAGTVRIWDQGTYELHKWEPRKVEVSFHGQRLRGRYGLFPLAAAGEEGEQWLIHRMDPPDDPNRTPMPERLAPMLARAGHWEEIRPAQERFAFEVKWDGVRALAYCRPGRLRLASRSGADITAAYPELRGLSAALGMREAVLDGEIIAFGADGRPSFETLQRRMHASSEAAARRLAADIPVLFAVFDLLYLDGRLLLELPWRERRAQLERLGLEDRCWRVPAASRGEGEALLQATRARGLEGVVAKRLDSRYEPGRRSAAWLKIKHHLRQELVIGGWLPGEGRRARRIGALLVGYNRPGSSGLVFAGRVGTGFSERVLELLAARLAELAQEQSPFEPGARLPRRARFLAPKLVAEIEFAGWTADGVMRAPSFKGLREDVDPREVVREPDSRPDAGEPNTHAGTGEPNSRPGASAPKARAAPGPKPQAQPDGEPRSTAHAQGGASSLEPQPEAGATPLEAQPEELFESVRRLPGGELAVLIDGRELRLTNWGKVLYPRAGFTKGQLIAYYAQIAPVALPHLRDRALTLKRYPDGVEGEFFYEKQAPSHRPEWVSTAVLGDVRYVLAQDRATLVWLGNLADLELHTSLALAHDPERPTLLAFDLDPGPPAGLMECCEVALVLRGLFEQLGLQARAKTSGAKGMQVYVPLDGASTYAQTKAFARRVAVALERRLPDLTTARMARELRAGRVFIDWSQNDRHKTTVSVYSPRARELPSVSTPLRWEEVERCRDSRDPTLLAFDPAQVLERVRTHGDLFADVLTLRQALPAL